MWHVLILLLLIAWGIEFVVGKVREHHSKKTPLVTTPPPGL